LVERCRQHDAAVLEDAAEIQDSSLAFEYFLQLQQTFLVQLAELGRYDRDNEN
jgi:hypothetical protein